MSSGVGGEWRRRKALATSHPTADAQANVEPDLKLAYRRTEFRVEDSGWMLTLAVDAVSSALTACHAAYGVTQSAYLTAWNPCSEPMPLAVNREAQARLEAELATRGYPILRGIGVDPSGAWLGEESVLVLGISGDDARRLGGAYGQNAILVAGRDAVARLVEMLDGCVSSIDRAEQLQDE